MKGSRRTLTSAAPPTESERRVYVMLPLRERERVALRHEALDTRLPLTALIRDKIGLPAELPPAEPRRASVHDQQGSPAP